MGPSIMISSMFNEALPILFYSNRWDLCRPKLWDSSKAKQIGILLGQTIYIGASITHVNIFGAYFDPSPFKDLLLFMY